MKIKGTMLSSTPETRFEIVSDTGEHKTIKLLNSDVVKIAEKYFIEHPEGLE